jgi:FkbH-like protein
VIKRKKVKIAVYGNYAIQFLVKALKQAFKETAIEAEIYEAEYDQTELDFFDASSELYRFSPDYILIHESVENIKDRFYGLDNGQKKLFAKNAIERLEQMGILIHERLPKTKIIYPTWEPEDDMVYGTLSYKIEEALGYQLRAFNNGLTELLRKAGFFMLIDSTRILLQTQAKRNYALAISADLQFSLAFLQQLSNEVFQLVKVFQLGAVKCVILDLDNTLWGGIIGDDGIENIQIGNLGTGKAYSKFQKWLKQLKERGIILAVCSKNSEDVAKEPFLRHTDMELRLEDIAVFVANWENKADNIRYIQSVLNIGYDSMVFLDDNPAERKIVKDNLPDVIVPDLPEDPAYYLPYLKDLNLFETTAVSENDKDRTKQYQEEAKRVELSSKITNINEYLQSLEMEADIAPFKKEDYSRIAQLTQRSNQFNLRTIRYSDADIERIANDENFITCAVKLKDRFGDYGLISVVILEKKEDHVLFIDTWLMSCRVLKRGVEQMLLNYLIDLSVRCNIEKLEGEYLPTAKNKLVEWHYRDLSFKEQKGKWVLCVNTSLLSTHYIKVKGQSH